MDGGDGVGGVGQLDGERAEAGGLEAAAEAAVPHRREAEEGPGLAGDRRRRGRHCWRPPEIAGTVVPGDRRQREEDPGGEMLAVGAGAAVVEGKERASEVKFGFLLSLGFWFARWWEGDAPNEDWRTIKSDSLLS